ncbi:ribonuclease HI family protein [Lentibacillus sp. CBA3610]|uniref:ribonuclease HI family protein n=1 Tax=Lentibacillus sp. CBA3610 TaxID=2518176 RepID=UPI00159560F2|nr:ribonuclease HI family protein [Lentibacillus sp. CBA3610]QKY70711.1 ribonuclease HI family protein [Lentibacillus sp. CBA3610]
MIEVYTDGASSGNPGVSGAGVYIKAHGQVYESSFPLGVMSNHEAEFYAVLKALENCAAYFPGEILSFRSDSKLVVDAIEDGFVKNSAYQPLLAAINEKASDFPYFFIKWIPEKQNYHADRLARQAINRS